MTTPAQHVAAIESLAALIRLLDGGKSLTATQLAERLAEHGSVLPTQRVATLIETAPNPGAGALAERLIEHGIWGDLTPTVGV